MAEQPDGQARETWRNPRTILAAATVGFAFIGSTLLAIVVVLASTADAEHVFNILIPVFATWVGAVLAYYFGQSNFESAGEETRKTLGITPRSVKRAVSAVMRKLGDFESFALTGTDPEATISLADLTGSFSEGRERYAILDAADKPRYMIHRSKIDSHVAGGGAMADTLQAFLDAEKGKGREYGPGAGFLLVRPSTTVTEAQALIDASDGVADVFVTQNGVPSEPVQGWLSDSRLASGLEA